MTVAGSAMVCVEEGEIQRDGVETPGCRLVGRDIGNAEGKNNARGPAVAARAIEEGAGEGGGFTNCGDCI